MSRSRRSSRVAKRGREPLAEVSANVIAAEDEKDQAPDINLLNLTDAAVAAADDTQPPAAKQRKKRGKYHLRLTTEQRTEIVHQWISGWTAPTIIQHFVRKGVNIPRSTIDNIIRNHRQEGRLALKPRHTRRKKYTDIDRATMATLQIEHQQWTYAQVRAEWQAWWSRRHNGQEAPNPSDYTIRCAYDQADITDKNLEWVPETRNDDHHIAWRKQYCTEAMNWDRHKLVFIDETGFNKHVHKRRGRSVRGQRAHAVETNSPGDRLNVCAAVSSVLGLLKYDCILTSYNKEEFAHFMQGLLEHPLLQSESCIICLDNVSWHHHELVKDVMDAARVRHRIVRIPSYSPHLNPIEYAFSVWKSPIKRLDPTTTSILIMKQVEDAAALITDTLISRSRTT